MFWPPVDTAAPGRYCLLTSCSISVAAPLCEEDQGVWRSAGVLARGSPKLLQRKHWLIVGPPRIGDGDRKAVKKRALVGASNSNGDSNNDSEWGKTGFPFIPMIPRLLSFQSFLWRIGCLR